MSSFSRSIKRFLGFTRSPIQRPLRSKLTVEAFEDRITPTAFPTPLTQIAPAGSLIYGGTVADDISVASEVDSYTIDLDAGQKLSIGMSPAAGLQGSFEILSPTLAVIGGGSSAVAGAPASAQNVPVATAGTYTINFTGLAGTTGTYGVQLGLNAQGEAELPGTTTNNTIGTAEDINGSFSSLGGGASRGAVLGVSDTVASNFVDISPVGTGRFVLGLGDDTGFNVPFANLSGFSFPYYGTTYTGTAGALSINASTNGLITFGALTGTAGNGAMATSPSQAAIAPWWDDLNILAVNGGNIYYLVSGAGASQTLTIQWSNVIRFASADVPWSFQAILAANGDIQFNYGPGITAAELGAATTGIKHAGTTAATSLPIVLNLNGVLTPAAPNQLVGSNISAKYTAASDSFALVPPPPASPDTYALTLLAGQKNTVALTSLTAGALTVSLLDGGGAVLQTAVAGATNVSSAINGFTVPADGTYYLQVTGVSNVQYSLVVTKNAAFDLENNDIVPIDITGETGALGYVGPDSTAPFVPFIQSPVGQFEDISASGTAVALLAGGTGAVNLDDGTGTVPIGFSFPFYGTSQTTIYVNANGVMTFGATVGAAVLASSFTNLNLTTSTQPIIAAYWDDLHISGQPNSAVLTQVLDAGGANERLVVQWNNVSYFSTTAPGRQGGVTFQAILGANGSIEFNYQNLVTAQVGGSPAGVSATIGTKAAGAQTVSSLNRTLVGFNTGPTPYVNSNLSTTLVQKSLDVYAVTLSALQGGLSISTTTPSDGVGEFVNTLNPKIELFTSTGVLLSSGTAGGDGRNETISNSLLTPGSTYFIRVSTEGGTAGEYFLSYSATLATPTTTVVGSSDASALAGVPVTLSATITPTPGSFGTVSFFDLFLPIPGGANIPVVNGVASFTISTLSAGTHPITAVFSGGNGFAGSTSSPAFDQVITAGAPTTTVIVSALPNPAPISQNIAYTVTVAGGASTDGETVALFDVTVPGSPVLVPTTGGVLAGGTAVLTIAAGVLPIGTYDIQARYDAAGSGSNLPSASASVQQIVTLNPTTTTLVTAYAASAVPFAFIDISGSGTLVPGIQGLDDANASIAIGFTFPFFAGSYTDIFVSTNGILTFNAGTNDFSNDPLSAPPQPSVIAPLWDDLFLPAGGNVYFSTDNVGTLIVQWENVPYIDNTAVRATFQAILTADGSIRFNYEDIGAAAPGAGLSATVGIADPAGILQLDFNGSPATYATFVGSGLSTLISPPAGPRDHEDPIPITYVVTVTGAANGDTVELRDANHGNALVPFTGGPLLNGTMTIQVLPTDFPNNVAPIETHNLVAIYVPTATNAGSQSAVLGQVLFATIPTTTTATTATPDNQTTADPTVIDVQVTGGAGSFDTDIVSILDTSNGNAVVATGALNAAGIATITIPGGVLSAGTHVLVASYPGDTENSPSISSPAITRHVFGVTVTTLTGIYSATPVPTSFMDISGTGALVPGIQGLDDANASLAIGFAFPFFGGNYSDIFVGTNGILSFDVGVSQFTNTALATAPATRIIAPMWDDLFLPAGGNVFFEVINAGTSLVIQWHNVPYFNTALGTATFQAILDLDGSIQFNYGALSTPNGNSATVGIRDPLGIQQLAFNGTPANYTDFIGTNKSTLITPPGPRNHDDTNPLAYVVTVTGGASVAGETFTLIDTNHGNTPVPFTGGPLDSTGSATIFVLPTAFPPNITPTDTHNLVAVYTPNPNNLGSQSANYAQVLYATIPTVTTATSTTPDNQSDAFPIVIDVQVTGGAGPFVNETVFIRDTSNGNVIVGSGVLNAAGQAVVTVPAGALAGGVHALVAFYPGDTLNSASTSTPPVTRTVFATTTTTLSIGYAPLVSVTPFLDISGSGTLVPGIQGLDDSNASIPIGFAFPFFGTDYSSIFVGTNGILSFNTGISTFTNAALSTLPTRSIIAPFWDDLNMAAGGGNVYFEVINPGAANQALVVQWNAINYFSAASGVGPATFEAILSANGSIEFRYADLGTTPGVSATVGISDPAGLLQLDFNGNPASYTTYVGNNLSTLIAPPAGPADIVDPNELVYIVTVTGDATDGDTVEIRDITGGGNVLLGTGIVTGGVAYVSILPADFLTIGTHQLIATYLADDFNLGSSSPPALDQIIFHAEPTQTFIVTATAEPLSTADPIVITVHVDAIGGPLTGDTVSILDASNGFAVVATTGGVLNVAGNTTITVTPGALTPGTHDLVAMYNGTFFNASSTSAPPVTRFLLGAPTTTLINTDYGFRSVAPGFVDIAPTGTIITALNFVDDGSTSIPIGFAFPFYGTLRNSIFVGSNGVLSFGAGVNTFNNVDLTSGGAPVQAVIAPYWDDLMINFGGNSHVFFQVFDVGGPDERLVIQWNEVTYFDAITAVSDVTFQAVLNADGTIEFHYDNLGDYQGTSATVGVKNASPFTQVVQVDNNGTQAPPGNYVGDGLSTLMTLGGPRESTDPNPINFVINVFGGASVEGETVILHDLTTGLDVPLVGGPAVITGGIAVIQVLPANLLPDGTHHLVVRYTATPTNIASVSAEYLQVIYTTVASTITATATTPNPTSTTQPIVFSFDVNTSPGGGPFTGTVTVLEAGIPILTSGGAVDPVTGLGTVTVLPGALSIGTHLLEVHYSGDFDNGPSTSTPPIQREVIAGTITTLLPYVTPVAPTFVDIALSGTPIVFGDIDDGTTLIPIGFSFSYFGSNYTDIYVNVNGLLTFGAAPDVDNTFINAPLSDVDPAGGSPSQPTIAPLWVDQVVEIDPINAPDAAILYEVVGSGSTQQLIIQWNDVSYWGDSNASIAGGLTYEVVLGADGSIQFNYLTLTTPGIFGGDEGTNATIGIKSGGTEVVQLGFASTPITPNPVVGSGLSTLLSGDFGPRDQSESIFYTVNIGSDGLVPDGETVTLRDQNHGNAVVGTGTLVGGFVTFEILPGALSVGLHDLVGSYAGSPTNGASQSAVFTQEITGAATPPTMVGAALVNGGFAAFAGVQRSEVISLQVTFDQPVELTYDQFTHANPLDNTGAFQFSLHANNQNLGSLPTQILAQTTNNITWTITFIGNTDPSIPGDPFDGFASIRDGVYDLVVDTAFVHPLGVPSVSGTTETTTTFHRLFGDATGEQLPVIGNNHVTLGAIDDNFAFRSSFNNPTGYLAYFDYDGDGVIGIQDNFQFRSRFNQPLTWTT